MSDEKIRLGGMALANGVLVHGPNAWACAVRKPDGSLRVEAEIKRFRAGDVEQPFLRGPARMLEVFALLPQVRRRVPEARLPFERPVVLGAMVAGAFFTHLVRRSGRLGPACERRIARTGRDRAAWVDACGLPRRRAHLDWDL
jgi:hypothetical protein